ncbi:MAG: GAF domain-containing protein [Anaerolineae bacterium]|nr:GAF domain-containing protein [Anaerolineae bacterium]
MPDQHDTKFQAVATSLLGLQRAADQARLANEYDTAIGYYTQALEFLRSKADALDITNEYDLLALRAESYGQLGNLQAQAADLEAMAALAKQMNDAARQIEVIVHQVDVANQLGNSTEAQQVAETAVKLARETGDRKLEADSLTVLGQAWEQLSDYTRAQNCREQALHLYRELDDRSGEAHTLWNLGAIATVTNKTSLARDHLEMALNIYHSLGDRAGEANVLNMLGQTTSDYARQRAYYEQALTIFQDLGQRERQASLYNNLGLVYWRLGLYSQACGYGEQAVNIARNMQMSFALSMYLDSLGRALLGLGAVDRAQQIFEEGRILAHDIEDRAGEAYYWLGLGRVALAQQQIDKACELLQQAVDLFAELEIPADQAAALAWLGAAYLAMDDWSAAHRSTLEAVELLKAAGDASPEFPPQDIWWLYYRVLRAAPNTSLPASSQNVKEPGLVIDDKLWTELDQAREIMLAGIATISDEGLRRNYLNKVQINHDLVIEWTQNASQKGVSLDALTEVSRVDDIQDQLKRMLDIGMRMSIKRDVNTLPNFIMDELVELSGAERAFLVLLDAGQRKFVVSSGIAPKDIETVKIQASPVLDKVATSLQAVLTQNVEDKVMRVDGPPELTRRTVLGIPLLSSSKLMGMIYADMRIINGHFVQADQDLLTVLANQAAVALENATWARTLEQRVAERTAELSTINRISQALVSELDLNAVIEEVGEKLRAIFEVDTVYLGLYDPDHKKIYFPYNYYRGQRYYDLAINFGEGLASKVIESRQPLLINENVAQHYSEFNIETQDSPAKSYLSVPITVSDSISQSGQTVIGVISVQSIKQEGLFDEADVRLLTTIAANVGVAIQKARLFEETQEAKDVAEATAHELAETLDHLRATQGQLIQSEKMAALGQLIAGIAHEVNTPLGAIRASIGNISHALSDSIRQLPELFQRLTPKQQKEFFALLEKALASEVSLSSREERKAKRALRKHLEGLALDDADLIADVLSDMGVYSDVDEFIPLFQAEDIAFILQAAYNLSSQQKNSQNITTAVERASKVVFALKSYARYGQSETMIEANITEGIDVVLTIYHSQLKRGVDVTKNYSEVPTILCLPDELNQVWTNLIHNAIQAMDNQGELEIDVFQNNGYVVTQISDSGSGIPDEIKDRIFEPFFTTKPAGEGSGLGLDIVRKIVEKHDGTIEVDSRPGRTTFRVSLPVRA